MKRTVALLFVLLGVPELLSAQGLPFHTETALTTAFEERGVRAFSMVQRRGDATILASPLVVLPFAPHQRITTMIRLPVVSKWMNQSGDTGDLDYSNAGIGDLSISAKWAFFASNYFQGTTRIAVIGSVSVPTGSTNATFNGGTVAPRPLQLGRGAVSGGLAVAGTLVRGRWGINADVGHARSASDNGFQFGEVTRYDVAIGFRIPDYIETLQTRTFQIYLEWNGSIAARSTEAGRPLSNSGGHVAYVSPGLQWVVLPQLLIEGSLQIPVVQDFNGTQSDFGVRPAVGGRFLFF